MNDNVRFVIFLLVLTLMGWYFWPESGRWHGPGVLAPDVPLQENLQTGPVIEHGEFTITCLARFSIKGRVLSSARYWFGRAAALVPVDLALGWGRMSDSAVLDALNVKQSNRFYRWRTKKDFPIPREEIIASSANMHLIPATDDIRRSVKNTVAGDIVIFSGYLVRVNHKDGWHWVSSLTRADSGHGACELVYVEEFCVMKMGGE